MSSEREAAVADPSTCFEYDLTDTAFDERPMLIKNFTEKYGATGFGFDSDVNTLTIEQEIDAFLANDALVTAMSIIFGILAYLAGYLPFLKRLDGEIKSVRRLLLLFPDEVARNVPAIVALTASMSQRARLNA